MDIGKLVNSLWKRTGKIIGASVIGGLAMVGGVRYSEASIVQDYTQTSEPIITKLDYRGDVSSLDDVGGGGICQAQSFIALDNFIIDGSLKLARISENEHNMYLKIWPDDNGIPDIDNEIGTTTNELTPRGDTLVDYYLSEFGFFPVQVTAGERYWIGLYNPDLNQHGIGRWSDYGNSNPYPDGNMTTKYMIDSPWNYYGDKDLAFSVTFSNIPEPYLSTLLGLGIFGLALNKKLKRKES